MNQMGNALYYKNIFRVFFLGLTGEIETSGDQGFVIEKNDFVMGHAMIVVDLWIKS